MSYSKCEIKVIIHSKHRHDLRLWLSFPWILTLGRNFVDYLRISFLISSKFYLKSLSFPLPIWSIHQSTFTLADKLLPDWCPCWTKFSKLLRLCHNSALNVSMPHVQNHLFIHMAHSYSSHHLCILLPIPLSTPSLSYQLYWVLHTHGPNDWCLPSFWFLAKCHLL